MLCLIITHNAQGCTAPKGECIYIRQSTSACFITNMLHFWHSENLPKPEVDCSANLYSNRCWLVTGDYFNFFIMFHNVSMMYPLVVISIMGLYSHWYGICIKVFMAVSGEEFCLLNKIKWVIVYVIYINSTIVLYV